MSNQASEGNQFGGGVPGIETAVYPHTVYVADDAVRPRWRFQFLVQNRSNSDLEVGECRILHRSALSGAWLPTRALRLSSTATSELAGRDITIGPGRVAPGGTTGLDLRDCIPGELPSAIRVEVDVRVDGNSRTTVLSRVVPLMSQRTRYLTFPLDGEWVAGNARADLHGLGWAFAFDFITPADWQVHLSRKGEKRRPEQWDSFDRPLYSPAEGHVVACENTMADLVCAPSAPTYAKGLPDGLPVMALFGNWILIETTVADYLLMVHLKQGSIVVRPGMKVAAGQLLGRVGNSGITSGAHLHIEILDGLPEFEKRITGGLRQAGLPLGFRDVVVHGSQGRQCGDIVPEKGDVVARRDSGRRMNQDP